MASEYGFATRKKEVTAVVLKFKFLVSFFEKNRKMKKKNLESKSI